MPVRRAVPPGLIAALLCSLAAPVYAAPPPPSGSHPRIFLSAKVRDALTQAMSNSGSALAAVFKRCQAAIDKPDTLMSSGYQGFDWSEIGSACALAYQITNDPKYATVGVKVWRALLEDVATLGDKMACVAGASATAAIASIKRDAGYAIREIGPHTALIYDWLHDAPGVTEALRQQSRDCFGQWITYYTTMGYHNDEAGANYHAGYTAAKTLISIAEAGEDGTRGDQFWTETVDDVFGQTLIANGLAQDNGGVPKGGNDGVLVGGDWPEGWEYGQLSVIEYSYSTRALEEQGVDLTLRLIYSLVPDRSGMYVGGDTETTNGFFTSPSTSPLDASILGPSSDQAAGWAVSMTKTLVSAGKNRDDIPLWQALADTRGATAVDPLQANLPLWYLARGTRNLNARSSWGTDAFWTVFTSAPRMVADHQHPDATNFVFVRGGDDLVVDPSPYAGRSTLTGNAMTVESNTVTGDYRPSQTPWSKAGMSFARGTASGVVAARGDFSQAYQFQDNVSDVKLARRDWVFLPEGEIVTIDRAHLAAAGLKAYLRYRTPSTLASASDSPYIARATVGGSALAIHAVKLSPSTTAPVIRTYPANEDCGTATFGACTSSRLAVNEYAWEPPGPDVLAVHVLDGLAQADAPADVAPVDAAPIDSGGQNAGLVGASVYRSQKQTFVLEPATQPPPTTITYGVPGANPSRHVVFDAPADSTGHTTVTAMVAGDRCVVTLTAGSGVTAGPTIFTLSTAASGCTVSEDADVMPGSVSPGTGGFDHPGGGGSGGQTTGGGGTKGGGLTGSGGSGGTVTAGCACTAGAKGLAGAGGTLALTLMCSALFMVGRRRRRDR